MGDCRPRWGKRPSLRRVTLVFGMNRLRLNGVGSDSWKGGFETKKGKRQLCLPLETLHRRSNPFREAGLEAGRLFARKDRVLQIGRASCRERVEIVVGGVS